MKVYGNMAETHSTAFCLDKPDGDYEYPGVESHYIKCWSQVGSLFVCPGGMNFNKTLQKCDVVSVDELSYFAECETHQKSGFYSSQDCSKFVRCIASPDKQLLGAEFQCPLGLHFLQQTQSCEWPESLQGPCSINKTPMSATKRDELDPFVKSGAVLSSYEDAKYACLGENGLIRSKSLCHRYYRCEYDEFYSFDCPKYMVFDQRSSKCTSRNKLDKGDDCFIEG